MKSYAYDPLSIFGVVFNVGAVVLGLAPED